MENINLYYVLDNNSTVLMDFIYMSRSIGIVLLACTLCLLILTAGLFKEWRQNYKNQLLIQFMFSRFLYALRGYVSSRMHTEIITFHTIGSLTMIYTELALVFWMFVFSKHMYDCFVKVFKLRNPNLYLVSLCTWLLPGVITLVFYLSFCVKNEQYHRNVLICLFVVKWPVICVVFIFLILILRSILKFNLSNSESNTRIIVVINILIFSFCIHQMFADIYRIVYKIDNATKYVVISFNILSMYHCTISILFWVFGNSKTREMWKFTQSGTMQQSLL